MTKSAKLYVHVSELQSQGPKGLCKLCEWFKSTEQRSLSSFSSSVVWWLVVAGSIHIDTYISNGAVGEVPKHTDTVLGTVCCFGHIWYLVQV